MPRTRHYHVGQNMCGYMPDCDVETYSTRKSAEDALRWMRDNWREQIWEEQDARDRGELDPEDVHYFIGSVRSGHMYVDRANPYNISTHLWIEPCDQADCQHEEES